MKWFQNVWNRVAKRLGMRKTGLVKLRHDVRSCEYEDVHVLWEMLKNSESEAGRDNMNGRRKSRHLWNNLVYWSRRKAPFLRCTTV